MKYRLRTRSSLTTGNNLGHFLPNLAHYSLHVPAKLFRVGHQLACMLCAHTRNKWHPAVLGVREERSQRHVS